MNNGPLRVLLIDDDEHSFVLTQELLSDVNGRPVTMEWASDFDEGLAQLLRLEHDVYLVDYRLGLADGIELLQQARAAGCRKPIIILTGQTDRAIDQRALAAGASDYLAKDTYDITRLEHAIHYALERHQLLLELEQERSLLRALMENLPDNIYFKDDESRFIRVSHAMAKWFGLVDPSDAVGKSDRDFFTGEHAEEARQDELDLMARGEAVLGKEECETWPDGRRTWVSTSKLPLRDERGKVVGTFGISRDITEQKEALNALRASERLNRMIVDTANDAFIAMDSDGAIIDWNNEAERTFGWKRADVLGEALADFIVPPRNRAAHWDGLKRFNETREGRIVGRRIEVMALHRDGHEFPAELAIVPIVQELTVFFAAFVHDISKRKQAEESLRRGKEAAEAANRAKSDFLANMSHEIRTPMNAILGMTELVLDSDLTPLQRDYLATVRDSGESLLRLLNDILDFSKIEAGKLELEETLFSLREVIGDTLKSLAIRANRERLELIHHIAPSVPDALLGDPSRLRQIVVNLVGNAIKFTERGEVVVRVTVVEDDRTEVIESDAKASANEAATESGRVDSSADSAATPRVRLQFVVSDTGIGIPSEKLSVVFQAFEQADTSTTRKYGGTGLGLAICSRLVDCMLGRIWAESEVGRGSRFYFTADFGVSDVAPLRPFGRAVQGTKTLVVDDNATNRLILDEMLRNWGMLPTCVESVAEAVAVLSIAKEQQEPFGLVVSDVHMPHADGFRLAELLHRDPRISGPVVILLTSGDRPGDGMRCKQFNVAAYLRKPPKQSELFDAIVSALGINQSEPDRNTKAFTNEIELPPLRVLLVEDSIVNQKLALGILHRFAHQVSVANNGREAVEMLEVEDFDVVLMDVQMPEMDGLEATRRIRESERHGTAHLPIIAMTAHAMTGDREKCLEAGMDHYVTKPVRAQLLFDAIRSVVDFESLVLNRGATADREQSSLQPSENGTSQSSASNSAATAAQQTKSGHDDRNLERGEHRQFSVDWSVAEQTVVGDRELLIEIAAAFIEEAAMVQAGLRAALNAADAKTASRLAHTIKAGFRTFGAQGAHDVAWHCEQSAKQQELEEVARMLPELEEAIASIGTQLREFLNSERG